MYVYVYIMIRKLHIKILIICTMCKNQESKMKLHKQRTWVNFTGMTCAGVLGLHSKASHSVSLLSLLEIDNFRQKWYVQYVCLPFLVTSFNYTILKAQEWTQNCVQNKNKGSVLHLKLSKQKHWQLPEAMLSVPIRTHLEHRKKAKTF